MFAGDDLPMGYMEQASLDFSAGGVAIASGPARYQRRIWAFSAYVDNASATQLQDMFRAWDNDRSKGLAASVAVTDSTGPGSPVTAFAYFTTPPKLSLAGSMWLASLGLTEV